MSLIHWHLQITCESSVKSQFLKICHEERRSAANLVRLLIEREIEESKNDKR